MHWFALNVNRGAIHADAGQINERSGFVFVQRHRIIRDADDLPWDSPIEGEGKGLDFDFDELAFFDETDIFVLHLRFNFDGMIVRDDDEQLLRRGDDATHRVYRQLLHNAIDGRDEA